MSTVTIDQDKVEQIVIESVRSMIAEKMNYNRTLLTMVEQAMDNQSTPIMDILNETIARVVANPNFKKTIKEEFERKVAKTIVGHLEGAVEKAANIYRQNPALKSRMILAIENIIQNEKIQ